MELPLAFQKVGIALALGLLVGLQRERVHAQPTGIRTLALITVAGAVAALLGQSFGGWVVAAGWFAVATVLVTGTFLNSRGKDKDAVVGLTTEVAALLMYGIGAYVVVGHAALGIALGGGVALVLHLKAPLHDFVQRIGEQDIKAIMQFVLVALVIFPALPDRAYGPYGSLNPHVTWLMVVLIVGISLSAYVAYRMVGVHAGSILGGILGGLISSTATTVSYARQCRHNPKVVGTASLVIVIASTIVLVRVSIEIVAVARGLLPALVPPFAVLFLLMAGISAWLYVRSQQGEAKAPEHGNPSQLKPAIVFGLLYAVVLLMVAFFRDYFGDTAIYAAALISGLTDVDALTLSVAELFNQERVPGDTAWRAILLATLSNLAFKAGAAGVLGGAALFRIVGAAFGVTILAGLAIIVLWP